MRTGWMTRVAVDSKHTDRRRLGLTIVLLWPRHWLYSISNDHQCWHLTIHTVCVKNTLARQITDTTKHSAARGNTTAPRFLFPLPAFSSQLIWDLLYNSSLSVYCGIMEGFGKPLIVEIKNKAKKKFASFRLSECRKCKRTIWWLIFCACMTFY